MKFQLFDKLYPLKFFRIFFLVKILGFVLCWTVILNLMEGPSCYCKNATDKLEFTVLIDVH